jgi:hypothetical protein
VSKTLKSEARYHSPSEAMYHSRSVPAVLPPRRSDMQNCPRMENLVAFCVVILLPIK